MGGGGMGGAASDSEREEEQSPRSPPTGAGGLGGLSGLSARLQQADEDEGGRRSGEEYYERGSYSRQSQASDRSAGGGGAAGIGARMMMNGRTSVAGEDERMRRDYEFKIATMQSRIAGLERDLEDAQERGRKWAESEERARAMEDEIVQLRRVSVGCVFSVRERG